MLTRFTPARCCCPVDEEPPLQPCPCLNNTLPSIGQQITISGFTMAPPDVPTNPALEDINDTYDVGPLGFFACTLGIFIRDPGGPVVDQTFRQIRITFTRNTIYNPFPLPGGVFSDFDVVMPVGVKAQIIVSQSVQWGTFGSLQDNSSLAMFYKVLPDTDGYVDCRVGISGFTFGVSVHVGAVDNIIGLAGPRSPAWLSTGSVSYAPAPP